MLRYDEALNFIHGLNRFGIKLGLDNIRNLLEILGNPQKGMKIIHVAGTNGKGSTCSMIASILSAAGYKVGLYTSPYLQVFNERIQVNGEIIPDKDIAELTAEIQQAIKTMEKKGLGSPTEFEVVTALAFLYFKKQAVDFIVLEVGMGGRLDATNVVEAPLVCTITSIGYDHQQHLGNTLSDIAREKCGIIKKGVPVVTSSQEKAAMEVIEETCKNLNCPLTKVSYDIKYKVSHNSLNGQIFDVTTPKNNYRDIKIKLLGAHQRENAATAIGAVEALGRSGINISKEAIYSGLLTAKWPGRLEIIRENPVVLLDGAHNTAGMTTLSQAIMEYFPEKRKILVLAILKDKDYMEMVEKIIPVVNVIIVTELDNPRALLTEQLETAVKSKMKQLNLDYKNRLFTEKNLSNAAKLAFHISEPDDLIIFAGSLYLVGGIKSLSKN